MKLRTLIAAICWIFCSKEIYACIPSDPDPNLPSYLDHEYLGYGWKHNFNLILSSYGVDLAVNSDQSSGFFVHRDSDSRNNSIKKEPENYAQYSRGSERFLSGAYEEALKIYSDLKSKISTQNPKYSWVGEASSYMIARCKFNMAQKNWDGYSDPLEKVNQALLQDAKVSYELYLKDYPNGFYADSARNISRKIFYLSGNVDELNLVLKNLMNKTLSSSFGKDFPPSATDRIIEFENFFSGKIDIQKDSPLLVAYAVLRNQKLDKKEISILEAREKDFVAYPNLFRYVFALSLYRLEKYQELLIKSPEVSLKNNQLSLGIQLLRSRALAKLGKTEEALEALKKMNKISPQGAIEMEVAYIKLTNHEALSLYVNGSPLKKDSYNLKLITGCGLTLKELETGITMKNITGGKLKALVEELSFRYLFSQDFTKLSVLLATEPKITLSPMRPTIDVLAKDPNNIQALADLGEFLYLQNIAPSSLSAFNLDKLSNALRQNKICKTIDGKHPVRPASLFRRVVDLAKKSETKSDSEAKALHYLTICEKIGESQSRCSWISDSSLLNSSASKEAFNRLHKLYQKSAWAKNTPYYY